MDGTFIYLPKVPPNQFRKNLVLHSGRLNVHPLQQHQDVETKQQFKALLTGHKYTETHVNMALTNNQVYSCKGLEGILHGDECLTKKAYSDSVLLASAIKILDVSSSMRMFQIDWLQVYYKGSTVIDGLSSIGIDDAFRHTFF